MIQHSPTRIFRCYLNAHLNKSHQTPPASALAISSTIVTRQSPDALAAPRNANAAMCYYMASEHTCGHLHQWFARCFQAKHDQTGACAMQSIPTWHYPEAFPCPPCHAQRKIDLAEFLASKGRQTDSTVKTEKPKQELPQVPILRSQNEYDAHPYYTPQNIWGREGQLQTMAEGALNLPLIAPSAHTPWVPPSRRSASIVGQLGSSSPPQAHTREGASAHYPGMLSVKGSSRPSSEISPPYPLQAEQLANQKMTVTDMQMARLLQQAED